MSAVTAPLSRPRPAARAAAPAVTPQLRVVERVARVHRLAYALLILGILAAGVFGIVALNAMAAANAVEARQLEARVAEGERRYGHLIADVAALEDPARIREAALDIGMVHAEAHRYVAVDRLLPADGRQVVAERTEGAGDPVRAALAVDQ